jgi:biotin synthase
MQRTNKNKERYSLEIDEVIEIILQARALGITTLMLQSGESRLNNDLIINALHNVSHVEQDFIACNGNVSNNTLRDFKKCGIKGFNLKFETTNSELFYSLRENHLSRRIDCLLKAKSMLFQISTGSILGLPGQTINDLVNDLRYIQYLRPPMVSVSPFIPSKETILSDSNMPDINLVLNFIALMRIANPTAMIPSVSALNLLKADGQLMGLNSGANVITCNLTPFKQREKYTIYNNDRFIVDFEYVKEIVSKANMIFSTQSSLGIKCLSELEENCWFDNRYNAGILQSSVYGEPSDFFYNKVIPLLNGSKKIIDLGCGDGRHSIVASNVAKQVISLDNNKIALDRIQRRSINMGIDNILVKNQDVFIYDDFDEFSDIICSNLIYYYEKTNVQGLINRILQKLGKGNYFYLSFESNIVMKHDDDSYFTMNNLFNYSKEDIDNLVNKCSNTKLLHFNISSHNIHLPYNSEGETKLYYRSFFLNEFLIEGI